MQMEEILDGYFKEASDIINAISVPSFSEDMLNKTASILVNKGLIKESERNSIIETFQNTPDKALESLIKAASEQDQGLPQSFSLGTPMEYAVAAGTTKSTKSPADAYFESYFGTRKQ